MSRRLTSIYLSPLRYPGGKGNLAPFLGKLIASQERRCRTYVEPFAGGAGAAVRLLFDEYVDRIVLNDLDRGVAAFWRAVFYETEALAKRVLTCTVSVHSWRRQRARYNNPDGLSDLELGFATLFLNRTNRSGILDARPIGGLDQAGQWKIDARFNRRELAERIRMLGRYRNRVSVSQEDGLNMVDEYLGARANAFVYADPPYLTKGSDLYLDTLDWSDHVELARKLQRATGQWTVTYDEDARVWTDLYPERRCVEFQIAHTAAVQHVGTEYAVFPDAMDLRAVGSLGEVKRPRPDR